MRFTCAAMITTVPMRQGLYHDGISKEQQDLCSPEETDIKSRLQPDPVTQQRADDQISCNRPCSLVIQFQDQNAAETPNKADPGTGILLEC